MTSRRGTSNTAIRGNAAQRRASKWALLARDGDGEKAPCWECGTTVTFETMVRDKIKTGRDGGRYTLPNLRIHCRRCSMLQGHRMGLETRRWRTWAKRGLRTSRISPGGIRSYLAGHWYVYLDGTSVGWLERMPCSGAWKAYRYSMTEERGARQEDWDGQLLRDVGDRHGWRIGAYHRTKRAALYALLVECTTQPRKVAA
jgi:hypothetical protein